MLSNKMILGAILLLLGIAILLESIFADGIGIGNNPSFGYSQTSGAIAGAILTVSGLIFMYKAR